jgi:hypothetical protein
MSVSPIMLFLMLHLSSANSTVYSQFLLKAVTHQGTRRFDNVALHFTSTVMDMLSVLMVDQNFNFRAVKYFGLEILIIVLTCRMLKFEI